MTSLVPQRCTIKVLEFLKSKPPFWPVNMNEFVPANWTEPKPEVSSLSRTTDHLAKTEPTASVQPISIEPSQSAAVTPVQREAVAQQAESRVLQAVCQITTYGAVFACDS